MKKFNLDQLPKNNPYKVPEGMFDEVQNNVLSQIRQSKATQNKPAKIFSIGWKYASAAAIVLLMGISFFFFGGLNNNSHKDFAKVENEESMMRDYDSYLAIKEQTEDEILEDIYANVESKSTIESKSALKEDSKIVTPKAKNVSSELDAELDVLISAYSSQELAKLSREVEHDVYLDIFY